ncbi:MAG: hypothetical protein RSC00_04600 [Ruthenibacterium sp.]
MIGFKFKRMSKSNWPEKRLAAIEQHIEKRARQLLELPRTRSTKETQGFLLQLLWRVVLRTLLKNIKKAEISRNFSFEISA